MSHHYLRVENLKYSYPGGTEALKGVSFEIKHGEKVALVGPNGAGKSTLLLHLNGLLLPHSGSVNVGDIPVCKKTLPLVLKSVGLIFQDADDQLFMPTVEEDVAFGPLNMGLPREEVQRRVTSALEAVGALPLLAKAGSRLSGGEKKRVAIATVMAMEPNILVMDEPTASLDPRARRQIIDLISSFSHTCLIATHDLEMVWELCPRTIVMCGGKILADGETHALFANRELVEKAGLEVPYQAMQCNHMH